DQSIVEVSHEALIRGWSRLRGWIDQDHEALRIQRQLNIAAELWEQHGREAGYLYRGVRLVQAEEWANDHTDRIRQREQAFLGASLAEREHEEFQRRRGRIFTWATIMLTIAALLIGALAAWALQQNAAAVQSRNQLATADSQTRAERDRTEQARQTAVAAQVQVARLQQETLSRRLAEAAQNQLVANPYLALLLAIEAERRAPTFEADQAIRTGLGKGLIPSVGLQHDGWVSDAQ